MRRIAVLDAAAANNTRNLFFMVLFVPRRAQRVSQRESRVGVLWVRRRRAEPQKLQKCDRQKLRANRSQVRLALCICVTPDRVSQVQSVCSANANCKLE